MDKPNRCRFAGVQVAMSPAEGTLANAVSLGKDVTSLNVSGLEIGSEYTFTVKTFDTSLNYSDGASEKATVADTADYVAPANVTNLYLNRLKGLDCEDENVHGNFIYVDDTVKGIDNGLIDNVEFNVTIRPLKPVANPLKLYDRGVLKDDGDEDVEGVTSLVYKYSKNVTYDVISLIYRKNTILGEYEIIFSQDKIVRATLICKVYEDLTELKSTYVSIETNEEAFENKEYTNYEADYIVAKGQKLGVIGDNELEKGVVKVKDMASGNETEVNISDLANFILSK